MRKIICVIFLFLGLSTTYAQSSWGVELGTINGVSYTHQFAKHWGFEGRLGLGASNILQWSESGLSPIIELTGKYTLSSESKSTLYKSGGYWGLMLHAHTYRLFGGRVFYSLRDRAYTLVPQISIGYEPTFGWVFGLGRRSFIRTALGLVVSWDKYDLPDSSRSYWVKPSDKSHLLRIELTYSYRF